MDMDHAFEDVVFVVLDGAGRLVGRETPEFNVVCLHARKGESMTSMPEDVFATPCTLAMIVHKVNSIISLIANDLAATIFFSKLIHVICFSFFLLDWS